MKKVVSFCLYGNKATYILGMKENIILGKKYFPTWEIRIYYNETVPEKYIKEYIEMGAICKKCKNIGFNKMNWEGMFWRFFPLNDPSVDVWLSRDADSRLSLRESKLVEDWLKSNKTLYTIRDHRCHYNPIMGGLFGINNKLFHEKYKLDTIKNIITNLSGYYKERPYNVDQIFLNDNLWKLLKDDVFAHISNGGRRIYDSDIEVPSVSDFMGKQYRLNDFPENIIKKLDKNKGCYWKKSNCVHVYWSNSSTDIKPDVKFRSEGEYYVHRVEHGYPQNWSGINIFDGIDIKKNKYSQYKNVYILDCKENRINPIVKALFTDLMGGFVRLGFNVKTEINKIDDIDDYSVIFFDNSITNDMLDNLYFKNKNCIYFGWCCHERKDLADRLNKLNFVFVTTETLTPRGKQRELVKNTVNYCPLYHRADEDPNKIGTFKRNNKYDWCYTGYKYKDNLIPTKFKGLNKGVKSHKGYLTSEERREVYLSSLIHLAYVGDCNIADGATPQRIFEGLSYGCIVLTNSKPACQQTENIPEYVGSLKDVEEKITYYLNNPNEVVKKQQLAYEFVKKSGTNHFTIEKMALKSKQLFNIDFLKDIDKNNEENIKLKICDISGLEVLYGVEGKYININDKLIYYGKDNRIIIPAGDVNRTTFFNVKDPAPGVLKHVKVIYNNKQDKYEHQVYKELDSKTGNEISKNKYLNLNNKQITLLRYNSLYIKLNKTLFPIILSFPKEKIVKNFPEKKRLLSKMIPGDKKTYIYNSEETYYKQYQESMFSITHKKLGWDCMRHYEVMANGSIPYFNNIENCPKYTLFNFPKNLIVEGNKMYKKLQDKDITDLNDNEWNEYNILANKIFNYTKENLTSCKIAEYILEKTNHKNVNNILFLSGNNNCDYLRDLVLYGLKKIFGKKCHDYPKIPHIYKNYKIKNKLYGRGFSYTNLIDQEFYDSSILNLLYEDELIMKYNPNNLDKTIENLIINKKYDIVIYGSLLRGNPYYEIVKKVYKSNEIIFLYGEDINDTNLCHCEKYLKDGHYVFIRELDMDDSIIKNNIPLVSIAISTYESGGKGHELLKHNLDHIFKQDYNNIEIVISDHSSDNKIKDLCQQYSNKKYPIKYIHNPEHKGNSSQNTNNAIKHCSGEYIKILFMDDYLYNDNAISIIVKKMQENPDKKWLVHSYKHTKDYKDFYNLHHPKFSHDIVFCNRIGTPSCLTIHNSVKERFDENLKWFMDSELYKRILDKYGQPIFLHTKEDIKPLMINLHHDGQVTNTSIDKDLIVKEKEYIINI